MHLIDLFPRTIAAAKLETLTPDRIERAIDYIEKTNKSQLGSDGAYTKDQHILDQELFREIKVEVIRLCKRFSGSYSHVVEDIVISNSWGNMLSHGQSVRTHKHNNSYISDSFYLTGGSNLHILNSAHHEMFGLMPKVEG